MTDFARHLRALSPLSDPEAAAPYDPLEFTPNAFADLLHVLDQLDTFSAFRCIRELGKRSELWELIAEELWAEQRERRSPSTLT